MSSETETEPHIMRAFYHHNFITLLFSLYPQLLLYLQALALALRILLIEWPNFYSTLTFSVFKSGCGKTAVQCCYVWTCLDSIGGESNSVQHCLNIQKDCVETEKRNLVAFFLLLIANSNDCSLGLAINAKIDFSCTYFERLDIRP